MHAISASACVHHRNISFLTPFYLHLMRFHGIMVVRDEVDVIAETVASHLSWADSLSICDHASADGTRQVLEDLAHADSRIQLFTTGQVPFSNGYRARVFERVRPNFESGDWVVLTDADEMFHVPPPRFVRDAISPEVGSIHSLHLDFVLTRLEAELLSDPVVCLNERRRSITERRTKFAYSQFGEFRLFRYRPTMIWPQEKYEPLYPGLLALERIPVRHYRARDPLQLQARCKIRNNCRRQPAQHHWNLQWADLLCNDDAQLHTWLPGMGLPEPRPTFEGLSRTRRIFGAFAYTDAVIRQLDFARKAFRRSDAPPQQGIEYAVPLQKL